MIDGRMVSESGVMYLFPLIPKKLAGPVWGDGEDQLDPREAAAWVSVARIALNLDEFITRE